LYNFTYHLYPTSKQSFKKETYHNVYDYRPHAFVLLSVSIRRGGEGIWRNMGGYGGEKTTVKQRSLVFA